jgi:hypothetical protein
VFPVRDGQQRVEAPENAIAAPFLGQLDGRPRKVRRETLELLLELVEERERVGRGAREPAEHLSAAKQAHLLGIGFHDRLANGHLTVAAERDLAVAPNGENGSGADYR